MPWGVDLIPAFNYGKFIGDVLSKDVDVFPGIGPNEGARDQAYWDKVNKNQLAEDAKFTNKPGGNDTPSDNYQDGTSVSSSPNYAQLNSNAIGQLTQSGGVLQNALNRLPGQLDVAYGNIDTQYNQRNNELNSQKAANENNYNQSTTQNSQNFRTNKNVINDQSSSGLRGLMRLLGSYGAVGSDLGLAGQAVSDVSSAQNAGAGQTFSQNQQGLDTNWGNYKNAFENEQKKVGDWRNQQRQSTEAQSLTTKQDLLSKLADIQGQIAAARGGSYSNSAQSYLDQANGLSGQIDSLGRIAPQYNGTTPVYNAPTLGSYDTGNGATIAGGQGGATGGLNTPYLNMLLGRDKRDQMLA